MPENVKPVAPFVGAKAAVFIGEKLVCLLRDDLPGLRFANCWDLPGGGREGNETGFETLTRELDEELGLDARAARILWESYGPSMTHPGRMSWFFGLRLPGGSARDILFGDEGSAWALMSPARFLSLDDAVPSLQVRLARWLEQEKTDGKGR